MVNVNEIISRNILTIMKQNEKNQAELANYMGISKQAVRKMLRGARLISAAELEKAAEFLNVPMEQLVRIPQDVSETNVVKGFMECAKSEDARNGLKIADEIADMVCFYERNLRNYAVMLQPNMEDEKTSEVWK